VRGERERERGGKAREKKPIQKGIMGLNDLYLRTPLSNLPKHLKPTHATKSTPPASTPPLTTQKPEHHSSQQRSDVLVELPIRRLQIVIDNDLVVRAGLGRILQLLLRLRQALLQRVGRLGAAALEARFERLHAGGLEEDEFGVEVGLFDLFYALVFVVCVC
jgi:hypothetical protein